MRDLQELSREELIAVVCDQAAQLVDQAAKLVDQAAKLVGQEARLADQAAELERLRVELEQIKRLVSRNSGNSSMPPSSDDAPGKGRPSGPVDKKSKTDRKRGKQPGAAGMHLPWLAEADVRVVDCRPQGACGCGADLAGAGDLGVERACQVTDVPLVTASTTEFRMHRVGCGCGRTHVAQSPAGAGVANTRVYGTNLRALVVYLLVVQHLPVRRCVRLVADLVGAGVSDGFAHTMLRRAAAVVAEVVTAIKGLVTVSMVVHFDETTLRVGKARAKKYVWVAATGLYTLYALGTRSGLQFRKLGIGQSFAGVAVHDRYVVYDEKINFATDVQHQLCCAHLLRDLVDASEIYPDANWPTQCHRALQSLIHEANLARDAGRPVIAPARREELVREFRHGVLVGLKEVPRTGGPRDKQPPARALLEDLNARHDDVVRCCYDTRIPPTNNLAERDLRPNKIQQNISGRLTSEKATFNRLAIRSYVSTAVKHQRKSRLSSRMQRVSLIRSFRCSRWCGYVVGGCGSATGQTEAASRRRQPFGEDAPSAWWRGLRCTSRVST